MSGRDAKFSSFSRFDPHLCQEEEKAISSRLVVPARSSDFPQTVPVTAVSVPQLQLQSEPQTQSQIQAHSLLQPQSEPQAQGSTARLPPAGSSPGEAMISGPLFSLYPLIITTHHVLVACQLQVFSLCAHSATGMSGNRGKKAAY